MKVIPAIDIIDGKAVRLTKGDYNQKTEYSDSPLAVAKEFEQAGITNLHLVDLDGAKAQKPQNLSILDSITSETNLDVDFGGGVKSNESLEAVFKAGAKQITAGSIAAKDKPLVKGWLKEFGAERIVLGADVINEQIAISGWQEDSGLELFSFLEEYIDAGAQYCICTDVSKDGMLQGPAIDLYKRILARFPALRLIASGGVAELSDLEALSQIGVYGTIVGKAYYEGRISLEELAAFNS
ncbi:1-(5-phosphoribosyl)-5-[(5-phosphoribosylamino)methylideneamino] imidazole-4-carboxamide isomerase [Roseivirga pacifica]|uniref:1-(5-phosphoribosyl)-5-[(5-phosphoribosylamino)methylideneamino] imidazole-4-carboxamide isomerase n=1 Tax=Roseivirga pacifica TaxID=1267423 RepID=A0A1I0RAJ1_9BACT|nr:1-(5-phosphoribosyl)-5-[(5-phosphoribosylamino)methylideneamino]imidazole-4-carboxamide isomerase [Roseivirga pacifica]RKQ49283.1 1-(5-phosphoribosyl)-5-[(5-phosphoribosylamino)methylideneamino] imidazole-4-carboxamide isomerase [Roseivirga pacifica]SEW37638.1 1-(5-phosphoribosyl)-5-[(5-phosphoribosylamino)methylideneamino] imidazole-4-carboxamide isomerase [Roseivirga pacifica]